MATKYTLPPLPYAYEALEPIISKQIMELHHQKHHQTYITNLNAALAAQTTALQANDVPQLIALQQKIKFNGGGHINHSLFWKNLAPPGDPQTRLDAAAPALKAAIEQRWGSVQGFTEAFGATLLAIQGSGWGWLVSSGPRGKLDITTTKDQDPVTGATPVFGVDMWEHAYYLQYYNNKAAYVEGIWKIINWATAEERYKNGVEGPSILKL
ncbi:superoxide dismutase [Aspergillus clavatus NRRL 1]|uniref:Superoxide dismutase n=1 Tax=Aspergillus clavatus (strain ATCC 1007 / CBS 513.65 / DSM 816 / NCTC 3887 / NRRL 1 / QM 1276 / 107) TaxID=344612 RepID=A1CP10_ASPCL|nr:Mn superoxide dismutase MnSOD [Aspergillus clavatus NRRL 1]EAW07381.1 Mn superoxide dismutase MnSOD [Aspergillus clavatus NRRL 1]